MSMHFLKPPKSYFRRREHNPHTGFWGLSSFIEGTSFAGSAAQAGTYAGSADHAAQAGSNDFIFLGSQKTPFIRNKVQPFQPC